MGGRMGVPAKFMINEILEATGVFSLRFLQADLDALLRVITPMGGRSALEPGELRSLISRLKESYSSAAVTSALRHYVEEERGINRFPIFYYTAKKSLVEGDLYSTIHLTEKSLVGLATACGCLAAPPKGASRVWGERGDGVKNRIWRLAGSKLPPRRPGSKSARDTRKTAAKEIDVSKIGVKNEFPKVKIGPFHAAGQRHRVEAGRDQWYWRLSEKHGRETLGWLTMEAVTALLKERGPMEPPASAAQPLAAPSAPPASVAPAPAPAAAAAKPDDLADLKAALKLVREEMHKLCVVSLQVTADSIKFDREIVRIEKVSGDLDI